MLNSILHITFLSHLVIGVCFTKLLTNIFLPLHIILLATVVTCFSTDCYGQVWM